MIDRFFRNGSAGDAAKTRLNESARRVGHPTRRASVYVKRLLLIEWPALRFFRHAFRGHTAHSLPYFSLYAAMQRSMHSRAALWPSVLDTKVFLPSSCLYTVKKCDISSVRC